MNNRPIQSQVWDNTMIKMWNGTHTKVKDTVLNATNNDIWAMAWHGIWNEVDRHIFNVVSHPVYLQTYME